MMHQSPYAPSALVPSIADRAVSSAVNTQTTTQSKTFEAALAFLAGIGLFLSVIVSNVFVIMDMCSGGLQVEQSIVPSPLSLLELSWAQMLTMYVVSSLIVVACGVVLMRYDLPKSAFMMYMVPAILVVVTAGIALRKFGRFSRYVAYVYLVIGSILTGMAAMYFTHTGFSHGEYSAAPVLYSLCLQGGLILAISAALAIEL